MAKTVSQDLQCFTFSHYSIWLQELIRIHSAVGAGDAGDTAASLYSETFFGKID